MEEKQHQLDHFLRRRLSNYSEDPSWNVPDDAIFQRAMHAIPAKKRRRRGLWIIFPTGLVASAVILGTLYFVRLQSLQTTVHYSETCFDHAMQTSAEALHSPLQLHIGKPTHILPSEENIIRATDSGHHGQEFPTSESRVVKSQKSPGALEMRISDERPWKDETGTLILQKWHGKTEQGSPSLITEDAHSAQKIDLSRLDIITLPGLSLIGPIEFSTNPVLATNAACPEITTQRRSARYGILISGNESWFAMRNVPTEMNAKLFAYENHQNGVGADCFIEIPLSERWYWRIGSGYHRYHNRSILRDQFKFEMKNVIEDPVGESFYHLDIDLVNPLRDYTPNIIFLVSDDMSQNDAIDEETGIHQVVTTLQFSTGFNYLLLEQGRLAISLGAGAGVEYNAKIKNAFDVSLYHKGKLYYNEIKQPEQFDQIKQLHLLSYGKIAIEYRLKPDLALIMESGYRYGLSSIRNNEPATSTQTFLHAMSLSVGIAKEFGSSK